MYNPTTIKEHLLALGVPEDDLAPITAEVNSMVTERILTEYFDSVDAETKEAIAGLSGEELITYLAEHKASLPQLSEQYCQAVTDETWDDYFRFIQESATA